jgi:hypothetical protein
MTRRRGDRVRTFGVIAAVMLAIVMGLIGPHLRAAHEDVAGGLPPIERTYIITQARTNWDNPFQRLAQHAFAIVEMHAGPACEGSREMLTRLDTGPWRVRAYTVFGATLSEEIIGCGA